MTSLEAIEYASKHSFLELYELGYQEGKHEAILQQANHDQAVQQAREECLSELATRLEEELIMCMPRDKVKYVIYKVHTVLDEMKEQK